MFPDMSTLLLALAVNSGFLALLFFILWQQKKLDIDGLGEWCCAYLVFALWAVLNLSLPTPAPWMSGIVVGGLWGAGLILLYEGLRRFLQKPRDYRLSKTVFVILIVLQIVAAVQQSIALRYFVGGSLLVLLFSLTVFYFSRSLGSASNRVFIGLTAAAALVFVLRLVSVLTNQQQVGLYSGTPVQLTVNALFTLVLPLMGMALLYMANQRAQQQLITLATRDSLTGVYNRRAFLDAAALELERSRRYGSALAVVQIDLDQFKRVNDRFGHQAGDRVLVDFATRVTGLLRSSDVFGRMGGEEFTLLLPQTAAAEALQVAERIRMALVDADITPTYTASLGVATTQCGAPSLEGLMAVADAALYRAKENGRNRVELSEADESVPLSNS